MKLTINYTNHRGDFAPRTITPEKLWLGSTEWHKEQQWLIRAYDHEKGAERDFALKDFGFPAPLNDGRPCSMDEFVAALIEDDLDSLDLRHACEQWVYGDWDGALSWLSDERAATLRGETQ